MNTDNHMTDAEYHAHPALNYSRIKHLRESPLHFRHACDNPKPSSTSMSWGSLVHLLVFEPFMFEQRYEVTTETDKRRKAYKDAKAKAEESGRGGVSLASPPVGLPAAAAAAAEGGERAEASGEAADRDGSCDSGGSRW